MVEHLRTKNKYDPSEAQVRVLDPHPAPPYHTIRPDLIDMIQQALQAPGKKDNKDEYTLDLIDPEKDYWNDTEVGRLTVYRFPGTCAVGDGSNHEVTKTMGSGFCTLKELHWDRRDLHSPDKIARHNSRY